MSNDIKAIIDERPIKATIEGAVVNITGGGGGVTDGDKGDIVVSGAGETWTIQNMDENATVTTGTYVSKVNQDLLIKVRKATSGTITKGQAVYIVGSTGNHLTVELARADVEATSAYTIGIAATTITSSNDGFVIQNGRLTGLSTVPTATFSDGDTIYLSETTAGGYRVGIPTAPNHGVLLGFVIKTSNGGAGEIDIRVQNYQELEELSDVYINNKTTNDFLVRKATRWENITPADVKNILAINNVDNTSDLNKPISTATQTALNAKENTITAGTTAQYYRGDKTFQTLDKTAVGLGNVDNTSDLNKPISTAAQTALDDRVFKGGDIMSGSLGMGNNVIYNVGTPINNDHATTKLYVDNGLNTKQPIATVLTNTTASFTTAQETKLAGIATGAEVNVNADWNAVSGDAEILNKPTISGTNTGDQNLFSTIAVAGQSNVVADSTSDTLTLIAGSNITLTTNATNDEITIASTGGGGGGYTDEQAQDAVGGILTDTTSIDAIYDDAGNTISFQREALTGAITASKNSNATVLGSFTTSQLNTALSDNDIATLTGGETLTNKTIALGSNTISGSLVEFNNALTGADFATGGGTATGTNTGDQTITLTSDVTGSGTGSFATTIANNAVTNAKSAQMITKTYKGRTSANTGDPEDVPVATLKTDLALVKGDVGLGNVDNTSDVNKPISTATQTALDLKQKTITSGTASPSGGVDGDIYLQYT
jgi:hypothetical protein